MIAGMRALCCPRDAGELAVALSLLEAEGISCFVHNDHFGSLVPGVVIPLFNPRTVMVADSDYERANDLLTDLVRLEPEATHSIADKIRMVLEACFFGWIMRGRVRGSSHPT